MTIEGIPNNDERVEDAKKAEEMARSSNPQRTYANQLRADGFPNAAEAAGEVADKKEAWAGENHDKEQRQ